MYTVNSYQVSGEICPPPPSSRYVYFKIGKVEHNLSRGQGLIKSCFVNGRKRGIILEENQSNNRGEER
jgi:hypothetical protein